MTARLLSRGFGRDLGIVALALLAIGNATALAAQKSPRSGTVQGIAIQVDAFRTAAELKLFPEDKNSPTLKAKADMTLGIVTVSVAPTATATLLNPSDFVLTDGSGGRYELAFAKLFNMCEGRRKQSCDLPFNIPKDSKVTTLIVGSLKLAVK